MSQILEILNEIAADNGRKHKESVFKKHATNDLFKQVCYLAYDPLVQFYQRKIPTYIPAVTPSMTFEQGLEALGALTRREKTGNEAIAHLKFILENVPASDAPVIEKIVLKDFDVGAGDSTIIATWPGLLHEYPMALSSAFKYALLEKLIAKKGRKYAQLKSDGARVNIHISPVGVVQIFTRKGREVSVGGRFDWLGEIEALRGHILDGEMLARDAETGKPMPRKTGNGLVNKAIKGTLPETEMDILFMQSWDIITKTEFDARKGTTTYDDRFAKLERLIKLMHSMNPRANIELIESVEVTTVEESVAAGEKYLAMGMEGAIIKHGDMVWEDARSKLSLKIKGERECDLKIVGIKPGEGKYEGMIGAYICESACGELEVNVGGGLTDEDRAQDPDEVIGKILGVLYNEKIKAKNRKPGEALWSLFLPRVHPDKRIRLDKTEADVLENIE